MKKLSILFIAFFTIVSVQAQTKIGDATLPNTVKFNEENLTINGGGLREKFFFDIYAGALYLKKKNSNANAIANADETMAIKLHILSGMMSRSKMANALREGFKKSTNGNMGPYNERIERFLGYINNEIEVGQVYDMVYEKGKGSVIYKDGKEKGHVKGLDFKKALFNIWLGNKPADKGLKKEMLGS
ncbi:chalcone isomerase-like protein [Aquimarina sp. MAR_2010_214]|uniref:chalcone isomerase family protein n=1 Tax=Aquimarina sp. MAR_2010_214 TaxID=1250026 RepID=UPI000C7150A6|nr:chalcone isomerase family protein [Aquimarina sp. MAR_2010_214]PKV50765.1 chalcone isomerase-like protein [Aquimarina sp. MAR_2010_214]